MKEIWTYIQTAAVAIGGLIGSFLGGVDGLIYALVVVVIFDYITGVILAIINHRLSSEIGFRGIAKKVLIFVLVGIGHIFDLHVIGTGSVLRAVVIAFYLANEGLSVLENAANIGLPIPKKLKQFLEQLAEEDEKTKSPIPTKLKNFLDGKDNEDN